MQPCGLYIFFIFLFFYFLCSPTKEIKPSAWKIRPSWWWTSTGEVFSTIRQYWTSFNFVFSPFFNIPWKNVVWKIFLENLWFFACSWYMYPFSWNHMIFCKIRVRQIQNKFSPLSPWNIPRDRAATFRSPQVCTGSFRGDQLLISSWGCIPTPPPVIFSLPSLLRVGLHL